MKSAYWLKIAVASHYLQAASDQTGSPRRHEEHEEIELRTLRVFVVIIF